MKEKIKGLLERELEKLDKLSRSEVEGLDIQSVKRLEVLIKCYASYSAPIKPQETLPDSPENQSTEDLLKSLTES